MRDYSAPAAQTVASIAEKAIALASWVWSAADYMLSMQASYEANS